MTREEAKELLPIIQAWTEGKKIQYRTCPDKWVDIEENERVNFTSPPSDYRIKPKPKYRPFKTKEECWDEMHKHPDFGWIKNHNTGHLCQINCFYYGNRIGIDNNAPINFGCAFDDYLFPDGAPFGIKEE